MYNASLIAGFIALTLTQACYADDAIVISRNQIHALGITTSSLPHKQQGEISGLPAQVIIPSNQLFVISTPLPAMIEKTLVGIGDRVKKGQAIARLQSPALAEKQRAFLQASVQNQLAQDNLTRDEGLWKDGIIAEQRYRNTRGLALEARATFSERKHRLILSGMSNYAIAQLQQNYHLSTLLTITSPSNGVILEKMAHAGQRLAAAVPIFKIGNPQSLALKIQAPLAITHNLKIGATISIPNYDVSGKLTAIASSLTGTNQTILLRGIILQGAERLRPGQFVEVSISTTSGNAQWELPNSAISRISGRTLIFIKTPQGFLAQTVQVINEGALNSVINAALKGDEIIAIHGVTALKSIMMGIGGGDQ
ncbi:MAG: efflux RND transporter periplasmic adaptor subunit [Gallionella sp.]